jgi:septal ring factor EnvC (AmiA/AmiB activator)
MNRTQKAAGFLFVVVLAVCGCGQGPTAATGYRSAGESAKVQRLEEDLRAAAAARDSFRQRLAAAEDRHQSVQRQLAQAAAERDALKTEVRARTAERDGVQGQYDALRKGIKELLGQAESPSAPTPGLVGSR